MLSMETIPESSGPALVPNFVIHVGPHKTGSTYIQRRLDQISDLLLAQGIYVPKDWQENEENPSHTGVVHTVRSDQLANLENVFTNLKSSDHRYVVISSEAFMDCDEEMLHQFCVGY